jgi:hypothetical protein
LIVRLQSTVQSHGAELLVIALGGNGQISNNERLPTVIRRTCQRGIQVLDLLSALEELPSEDQANMFDPRGHYSPLGNGWVASRVAEPELTQIALNAFTTCLKAPHPYPGVPAMSTGRSSLLVNHLRRGLTWRSGGSRIA